MADKTAAWPGAPPSPARGGTCQGFLPPAGGLWAAILPNKKTWAAREEQPRRVYGNGGAQTNNRL